jgi:hypothetical protein
VPERGEDISIPAFSSGYLPDQVINVFINEMLDIAPFHFIDFLILMIKQLSITV